MGNFQQPQHLCMVQAYGCAVNLPWKTDPSADGWVYFLPYIESLLLSLWVLKTYWNHVSRSHHILVFGGFCSCYMNPIFPPYIAIINATAIVYLYHTKVMSVLFKVTSYLVSYPKLPQRRLATDSKLDGDPADGPTVGRADDSTLGSATVTTCYDGDVSHGSWRIDPHFSWVNMNITLLVGGLEHGFYFSHHIGIYWEWNNHPNWRTPSFFRGVAKNHQPD